MSALTIALTVLAIVVAVASVWGFNNIKSDAKRSAEDAAKAKLAEYLDSTQIQDKLRQEIARRVGIEADTLFADIAMSFAYPKAKKGKDPEEPIGKEYPGP